MVRKPMTPAKASKMAAHLLAWYDRHRRRLPWRALPGKRPKPYHVWLSEIMLQQTTVPTVGPYFEKFLTLWPRVEDLAAAPLDDVLTAWAGLGYYARARNLHKCAKVVAGNLAGRFPETEESLLDLPGIGPYTAAAISAIAFDRRATILDGNVERVIARIFRVEAPLPKAKPELRALADRLTPEERPGDYAQAIMDLGATICTPRKPKCALCPWRPDCAAFKSGEAEDYPRRLAKAERPTRYGVAFWISDGNGSVALRRREEKGLLGGMMEIPSTEWRAKAWTAAEAKRGAPIKARWRAHPARVRHVFTHFTLELDLLIAESPGRPGDFIWAPTERLGDYPLPSLMRKVAAIARPSRSA
jgi:A/G-specific adenine glycosylase